LPVRLDNSLVAGAAAALFLAAAMSSAQAQSPNPRGVGNLDLRGPDSDLAPSIAQPGTTDLDQPALPAPEPILPQRPGDATALPILGALPDPTGTINYGKPKPKKPKLYQLYKPNPRVSPPLPPLVPYATAPGVRKKPNAPLSALRQTDVPASLAQPDPDLPVPTPPPTVAVLPPLPLPRRPVPDPDPFAPTGIHAGTLRLFPYVETDTGYESNPNRLSEDVKGSPYVHAEAGLKLESDWSQNSLTADLHGGYSDYFLVPQADRPDAAATITGRVDVTRDTQLNSETRFSLTTQQPGSPLLAVPNSVFITNRPLIMSYGETFGVTQNFNRLQVTLRGSFDRYTYADAEESNGTTLALSTENYNDYGLNLRVGYELTPGMIPFVQLGGDLRRHDTSPDFDGFDRDSNGIAIKVGSRFELTRLLTGELSVGYAMRDYADPRLPMVTTPTVDGSLVYTVTPLTTITLKTSTDISETINAFDSAAVSRGVGLEVAHALLRNLTITASGRYQNNEYIGQPVTENFFTAGLAAEYKLSREVVLRASYSHEDFHSTLPSSNFTADVFLLGLRLQR
jgi:hypothetical protein